MQLPTRCSARTQRWTDADVIEGVAELVDSVVGILTAAMVGVPALSLFAAELVACVQALAVAVTHPRPDRLTARLRRRAAEAIGDHTRSVSDVAAGEYGMTNPKPAVTEPSDATHPELVAREF